MRKSKLIPLILFLTSTAALAEDAVIFTADEADVKAFDKLLSEQEGAQKPAQQTPFGQAVKKEAELLREQRPSGSKMGAWVKAQRSRKGQSVVDGDSVSGSPGKSGEAHGVAADVSRSGGSANSKKSFGNSHKK